MPVAAGIAGATLASPGTCQSSRAVAHQSSISRPAAARRVGRTPALQVEPWRCWCQAKHQTSISAGADLSPGGRSRLRGGRTGSVARQHGPLDFDCGFQLHDRSGRRPNALPGDIRDHQWFLCSSALERSVGIRRVLLDGRHRGPQCIPGRPRARPRRSATRHGIDSLGC